MIGDKAIKRSFLQRDSAAISWESVGVQMVIECTGMFTDAERKAKKHLRGPCKKGEIISAPAKNEDITIVLGVRMKVNTIQPSTTHCVERYLLHHKLSGASWPKVIHDTFKIQCGTMTTIHSVYE